MIFYVSSSPYAIQYHWYSTTPPPYHSIHPLGSAGFFHFTNVGNPVLWSYWFPFANIYKFTNWGIIIINPLTARVIRDFVCLLLFYVLATSKVIWGRVFREPLMTVQPVLSPVFAVLYCPLGACRNLGMSIHVFTPHVFWLSYWHILYPL